MRNALAKANRQMVGAWSRAIIAQTIPDAFRDQLDTVVDSVAGMVGDAKAALTAFADFPQARGPQTQSATEQGSQAPH